MTGTAQAEQIPAEEILVAEAPGAAVILAAEEAVETGRLNATSHCHKLGRFLMIQKISLINIR